MPNRFEPYLEEMERSLRSLPATERQEWRAEAHQHLDALAVAHEELGATPEEATQAALTQFGDAAQIARNLRHQASVKRRRELLRELPGAVLAVATVYIAIVVSLWGILTGAVPPDTFGPITLHVYSLMGLLLGMTIVLRRWRIAGGTAGALMAVQLALPLSGRILSATNLFWTLLAGPVLSGREPLVWKWAALHRDTFPLPLVLFALGVGAFFGASRRPASLQRVLQVGLIYGLFTLITDAGIILLGGHRAWLHFDANIVRYLVTLQAMNFTQGLLITGCAFLTITGARRLLLRCLSRVREKAVRV